MKKIIKQLLPPILTQILKGKQRYGWFGPYSSWNDAKRECTGYDVGNILEKCKEALLEVKKGNAVYERDSVIFPEVQYSWPLVGGLMSCAVENNGRLDVLDFGGSLGSSYFQNRTFLKLCKKYSWSIVEQENFVKCGKELFENDELKFYYRIEDCIEYSEPNLLLLSSVLQYIECPYDLIRQLCSYNFSYVVVDRTPFVDNKNDFITIQKVPPEIYKASYPCWVFNKKKFISSFLEKYEIIAGFDALDQSNLVGTHFNGFLMKLKGKDRE